MAQLYQEFSGLRRPILRWSAALILVLALPVSLVATPPTVLTDPPGDTRLLRTDETCGDPFDAETHHLPDIVELRLGAFQPYYPNTNLFFGTWAPNGGFVRLDIVFNG